MSRVNTKELQSAGCAEEGKKQCREPQGEPADPAEAGATGQEEAPTGKLSGGIRRELSPKTQGDKINYFLCTCLEIAQKF